MACGDRVMVERTAEGQGVVEAVDPRRSLLYRSDQYRQKLIAANATQMVIVLAAVPSFSEDLLNRCLAAAEDQGIRALIVLNKFDLIAEGERALDSLKLYAGLGYTVLPLTAKGMWHPCASFLLDNPVYWSGNPEWGSPRSSMRSFRMRLRRWAISRLLSIRDGTPPHTRVSTVSTQTAR